MELIMSDLSEDRLLRALAMHAAICSSFQNERGLIAAADGYLGLITAYVGDGEHLARLRAAFDRELPAIFAPVRIAGEETPNRGESLQA